MPVDDHDKKFTKLIWRGITIALIFGVAAGILVAAIANGNAGRAITCVNDALSTRNAPQANDAAAHIDFAVELQKVLTAPKPQQAAEYRRFLTVLHGYVHTLKTDQKVRSNNPLGKC